MMVERSPMILDSFRLDKKVALVTGCAQGLGQGMALALAEAGADIAGVDLGPAPDTEQKVTALGRRYYHQTGNLIQASVADLGKLVDNVVAHYGHIDILVNNAGIIRRAPVLEHTEKDWDDVIQINLKAVFFLSQAAAKHFVAQKSGKIINIASLLSFQGGIRIPGYTASKSGVAGITKLLANELAAEGVNANAIAPGYMATANTQPLRNDPDRSEAILARIPAGRWGTPADLAGAAVFLASSASDYINGCILNVDGGWLAR
jgi:2-dehydro-3-deoxy-D-gluconate 5-dehydrogenase